jgi:hypothetical protein
MKRSRWLAALAVAVCANGFSLSLHAGEGYTDTPLISPDSKWKVHDANRPQPTVITPGTFSTQEQPGKPPSDAIVLFDGKDTSKWTGSWKVENGCMVASKGSIQTKEEFGDIQLHIEWSAPTPPKGKSQGRGNSGVFLMGRYEIQVLDCYQNVTYADGMTAALYGQYPPLVNACVPPGKWMVYDILWTAPRFEGKELKSPAYVTVLVNGVVVHNHTALLGPCLHKRATKYTPHGPTGPIGLQDHGNPVRFRNIWVRPIKGYDEK